MTLTGERRSEEFELTREVLVNKKNIHSAKENRD
jgi:hypothetical protein